MPKIYHPLIHDLAKAMWIDRTPSGNAPPQPSHCRIPKISCCKCKRDDLRSDLCKLSSVLQSELRQIEKLLACNERIAVCASKIGTTGYIINSPGIYCLSENINFNPTHPNATAIIINASNVVLDLNYHTLTNISSQPGSIGIVINGGSNILVENGKVEGFTLNGIRVNSGTDRVNFQNLSIIKNGTPNTDPTIGISGGGIITLSSHILVENSHFDENQGVGLGISGSISIRIDESTFNSNTGTSIVTTTFTDAVFGLAILAESPPDFNIISRDMFITSSVFNGNTAALTAFGCGILAYPNYDMNNVLIQDCIATDTQTTLTTATTGIVTEGITLTATNVLISGCLSQNTGSLLALTNHVVGIEASGYNIVVEDSTVEDVSGSSVRMAGFDIEEFGSNLTYRNCNVESVINSVGFAYGYGLSIPIILDGIVLQNQSIGNVIESCVASNVHSLGPTGSASLAAGFLINGQTSLLLKNSITSNSDIGFLVHDYSPSFPTTKAILDSNQAINNTIGFQDDTAGNNAYINNLSRATHCANNYVGSMNNSSIPIVTWPIDGVTPYPTNITKITNLSLCP
jgi:hypothetical protein